MELWPRSSDCDATIGGESFDNGFAIRFCEYDTVARIEYRVRDEHPDAQQSFDWMTLLTLCALIVGVSVWLPNLWWPHVIVPAFLLQVDSGLFSNTWKRWHWIEHQTCAALECGSLDAHQQSPLTVRCGSSAACTRTLSALCIASFFDYGAWAVIPLASLCAYAWHREVYWLGGAICSVHVRRALLTIGLPVALIVCLFQRLFFVRKPTPEQVSIQSLCVQDAERYIQR